MVTFFIPPFPPSMTLFFFCALKANKKNQIRTKQKQNVVIPLELLRHGLSAWNIVDSQTFWFPLAIFSN